MGKYPFWGTLSQTNVCLLQSLALKTTEPILTQFAPNILGYILGYTCTRTDFENKPPI